MLKNKPFHESRGEDGHTLSQGSFSRAVVRWSALLARTASSNVVNVSLSSLLREGKKRQANSDVAHALPSHSIPSTWQHPNLAIKEQVMQLQCLHPTFSPAHVEATFVVNSFHILNWQSEGGQRSRGKMRPPKPEEMKAKKRSEKAEAAIITSRAACWIITCEVSLLVKQIGLHVEPLTERWFLCCRQRQASESFLQPPLTKACSSLMSNLLC